MPRVVLPLNGLGGFKKVRPARPQLFLRADCTHST